MKIPIQDFELLNTNSTTNDKIARKERSLLFSERILLGNGTEPFNVVFAFRLKGAVKHENFTIALGKLQRRYPQLQMAVEGIKTKQPRFFIPLSIRPIPFIVKERQHSNEWQQEALSGLSYQFSAEKGPMMRLVCLRHEESSDLILSFHHCICDGGGGVLLIRELLSLLDDINLEIGKQDRLLLVDDIIPKEVKKKLSTQLKTSLLAIALKAMLSISTAGISVEKKILHRSQDYLLHLKLDNTLTSKWINTCKRRGITVNTAIGLLLLNAYKNILGQQAKNNISCPVNIRKYASNIGEDQLFSFGLVLTLNKQKGRSDSFWEEAYALQQRVNKQTEKLAPYDFLIVLEKSHSTLPNMMKLLTYGKVKNDLMFSNIGKIPLKNDYKHFQLETVFSPMAVGPFANPTTITCSTFNGQLDFSFISNERFLSQSIANNLLDYMKDKMNSLIES